MPRPTLAESRTRQAAVMESRETVTRLYRGMSLSAVALRYSVSPHWLKARLTEWGVSVRGREEARELMRGPRKRPNP